MQHILYECVVTQLACFEGNKSSLDVSIFMITQKYSWNIPEMIFYDFVTPNVYQMNKYGYIFIYSVFLLDNRVSCIHSVYRLYLFKLYYVRT